jgi:hypothetical protein
MAKVPVLTTIGSQHHSARFTTSRSGQRICPAHREAFHRSRTSLGAAHWLREAGILAPLVVSEFVKDPPRQWRYIRMISIGTALLSQGMWAMKVDREREAARERELMVS